jgi:hypothetical protein
MRIWIFPKTFRFGFGNVFTFHLNTFAQSLFTGVKDRFELGLPDRAGDLLIVKRSSSVNLNSCLAKASFSFSNKSKSEDAKSGGTAGDELDRFEIYSNM